MDRSDATQPQWQVPAGSDHVPVAGMELLSQLKAALETYQRLLDDFAAHRIDFDSFRRQAFRAGLVMCDGSALLLDLPSGTWYRYDGIRLYPQGRAVPEG